MTSSRRPAIGKFRVLERVAWVAGLVLLLVWSVVRIHGESGRQQAIARFEEARNVLAASAGSVGPGRMDTSLWSDGRIAAWRESFAQDAGTPLAVLDIPSIGLQVPVYDGTDEGTLNRAVGRIEGTAFPGEAGNVGIAGHRDGFFRGLKDVRHGDVIELVTLDGIDRYVIEWTSIVMPEDVGVLEQTDELALTLVTCYPFYFVGSAPERFIVRAVKPQLSAASH